MNRSAWLRHLAATLRHADYEALAERAVLATVLAIAALISYTHLNDVWTLVRAPWDGPGPLTVDGLFAAAWLRMRRRRRQGQRVGWLAMAGLGGALAATLAGNVAAAFPGWVLEQRDYVAPVVYAWAAIAFALVFELVTGHARKPRHSSANAASPPGGVGGPPPGPAETPDQVLARLVDEGATQKKMAAQLGVSRWRVRELLAARGGGVADVAESATDEAEGSA